MAAPRIQSAVFINGPQKGNPDEIAEQRQVKVTVPGPDERSDPNAWDSAARRTARELDRLIEKAESSP